MYFIYIGFRRLEGHHFLAVFVEPEHSGTEGHRPTTVILGHEELNRGSSHTQQTCLIAFFNAVSSPCLTYDSFWVFM